MTTPIFPALMRAVADAKGRMTFGPQTFACVNSTERQRIAAIFDTPEGEPLTVTGIRIEADDSLKDGEVILKGLRALRMPFPSTEAE